ncbi:MAG: GAF domain-containing protein [Anaerolineae bacterium]|nr:GAF domain-containing protein [Anaerolineae bacterium]
MTETAHIQIPAAMNEARRIRKVIIDLEGMLREQRQMLSRQGMGLPPGTLTNLQQLRDELDGVTAMLEERYTELQQLRAVGRNAELINSVQTLDDVLNEVMDTVISLTRAERGYLMLRNVDTGEMEFRIARNIDRGTLTTEEFTVSRTVVEEVARTGQPVVTVNAGSDPRFSSQQSIIGFALRSILCAPLLFKGEVTGVIYTDNRIKQGLFGEKEGQLLQTFANQAAVAIENARLFEGVRSTLAQITAIRDLMSAVFASIASGVITTDADDNITQINEAAIRILNLENVEIGTPARQTLHLPDELIMPRLAEARKSSTQEIAEIEQEIAGRGITNLSMKFSPLRSSERTTEGVAIVVDDLTEIKQREAQLNVVRRYLTPAMVDNIESLEKLGLGGERRNVTVMFIDVRSLETFSRFLKPTQVLTLLNDYLTIAADAVGQQNGIIDKYNANEVMCLFNTQLNPDEDHSWRAVLAAVDMVQEFRKFHRNAGAPEGTDYVRVGINTGDATLGNVGSENRREFTAIGDNINVGHRLLENAHQGGEIVISEQTAARCWEQLTDPQYGLHIADREELYVKGRAEPVFVYRISVPVGASA